MRIQVKLELKSSFQYWFLFYLEIPITIYTPADVKKDKMVIYFHGGGKHNNCIE